MAKIISEYREEAKRKIMQAGFEILYEKGYCNTTMDEIARRLNVTKPALYRYFKNKDELIIESAKEKQNEYNNYIIGVENDGCPIISWIEIFDTVIVDPGSQSLYLDIISMSYRKEELKTFSCTRMDEEIQNGISNILILQKDGRMREDIDPRFLMVTLIALFNGMRMQFLLGVDITVLRDTWIQNLHHMFFSENHEMTGECDTCRWVEECRRFKKSCIPI